MTAEDALLRLAAAIPAAFGGWLAAAVWLPLFRVRDAALRAAAWTTALLPPLFVLAGSRPGGMLELRVLVPQDWFLHRHASLAPAVLATWALVAAALLVRHAARDARLAACLDGLAATSPARDDVLDAVQRTARWLAVAPPRVVTAATDGTAFVAGARRTVLFVPLALWDRLDAAGRRAMLLHELAHVRRRDPLRLRIVAVVLDLLWPAFAMRWSAARLADAWEAQADDEAVQGGATRRALAKSLVAAAAAPAPARVLAFGCPARETARRLAALRRRTGVLALALQAALLACLFPWWPCHDDLGPVFRRADAADGERRGVVTIGLAGVNPLSRAVERPLLERWAAAMRAGRPARTK